MKASGTFAIAPDNAVSGGVTIVIFLNKTVHNVWPMPKGMKLTARKNQDFEAGNFYANIHGES